MKIIVFLALLSSGLCLNGFSQQLYIKEPSTSLLTHMVHSHFTETMAQYAEVEPEVLQIIANALLSAYELGRYNFKWNYMSEKLIRRVWQLHNDPGINEKKILKKITLVVREMEQVIISLEEAKSVWNMITAYLELPGQEKAHALFTEIAKECVKITGKYLDNTQELLLSSCKQAYENSSHEALRINTISNFFRGISEDALPYEVDESEHNFALLTAANNMVLTLKKEQLKLIQAVDPLMQHADDIALMNITLDSLYYERFYDVLQSHYPDYCYVLFNQRGRTDIQERTIQLPAVKIVG